MSGTLSDLLSDGGASSLRDWGPWRLNASTYVLELPGRYEVDLERCLDSAEVLDYLAQVAGKRWATPPVIAGLVVALDDVLKLQAHLCSFGVNTKITADAVRRRVRQLSSEAS